MTVTIVSKMADAVVGPLLSFFLLLLTAERLAITYTPFLF